jgi:hypothetical protein
VNLTGALNNTGNTLALTSATGSWRLAGGSITGGSITRTGGADLLFTTNSGALNNVSIPGDVTFTESSARVEMRSGSDFTGNATLSVNNTTTFNSDLTGTSPWIDPIWTAAPRRFRGACHAHLARRPTTR